MSSTSRIITIEPSSSPSSGRGGSFLRRKKISHAVSMTYISSSSSSDAPALLKSCLSTSNLATTSMQQQQQSPPLQKRSVTFSNIEIREYETTLGDNPSVRAGPPIGLGWDYDSACHTKIDDYESQRGPRRSRHEMLLPRSVREDTLREWGVSRLEMSQCIQEVHKAQRHRSVTMRRTDSMEHVHEAMERAGRTVKRLLFVRKNKANTRDATIDAHRIMRSSYNNNAVPRSSGSSSLKTVYSMNDLDKVVVLVGDGDTTASPPPRMVKNLQAKSCCNLSGFTSTDDDDDMLLLPHEEEGKDDSRGVGSSEETLKSIPVFRPPDVVDAATEEEEEEDPLFF